MGQWECSQSVFFFLFFGDEKCLLKKSLIVGLLLYTIVTVYAIHQHEMAIGIHMSPPFYTLSHLPPHLTPPGCHRALALGSLHHTANSHWLSILYMAVCII